MNTSDLAALAAQKVGQWVGSTRLVDTLGSGTYGSLFIGISQSSGDYVAVKMISKNGLDAYQLELQREEVNIHSSLHHPNIVRLITTMEDDNFLYMVMELCAEGDLYDIIHEQNENGTCDEEFVRSVFIQTLDAVEYLHSNNVYHRDIKPENILKTEQGIYKLADFGLATRENISNEFGTGSVAYLGPEHFDEDLFSYSPAASDVWALGILLLTLITGKNPWQEASLEDSEFAAFVQRPRMLREKFPISDEVYDLLTRVLCLEPSRRITVAELRRTIGRVKQFGSSPVSPGAMVIPIAPRDYKNGWMESADSGVASWDELEGDLDFSRDPFVDDKASECEEEEDEGVYSDDELFINSSEKDSWWL